MIFLDTETCGFHGLPVLIQWAQDDGEVQLFEPWRRPFRETLELIEFFCTQEVCGFNLAFDWFHLAKIYTTFLLFPDKELIPEDYIDTIAILEEKARFTDVCIKPVKAMDLMLHARKTEFQALMDRDDIRVRKVPTSIAWELARELEKRIRFDDIYFAKAKDKYAPKWKVYDIKDSEGRVNKDFKDIVLKFKASGGLKNLYRHVMKIKDPIFAFKDIEVAKEFRPVEIGYAPFALAVAPDAIETGDWKGAWPEVIYHHIGHWGYSEDARKYAGDDVVYTRTLWNHFGCPQPGDDDSELACAVAVCRWRGFAISRGRLEILKRRAKRRIADIFNATAKYKKGKTKRKASAVPPRVAKAYLQEVMHPEEILAMHGSTKKTVLEEIETWLTDCECQTGPEKITDCQKCHGTGTHKHPAAKRAREILDARQAEKEIELYDKLLLAGRFHASFIVIGTLSSRMAGTDGLNAQGIKHQKYVRRAFPLADRLSETLLVTLPDGEQVYIETLATSLCGGDFKSFEVSIADVVFDDKRIHQDLLSGKKIHAQLGMELFPGHTYEQILASDGTDNDMYDKGKKGVFLIFYAGDEGTFKRKLGIPLEIGKPAFERFINARPGIVKFRKKKQEDHGALRQPNGIGSKIEYHEPKDYVESFLGFRRYFTLENKVVKALFEMAQDPPAAIRNAKIKVLRRDRVQTAAGAAQSALYGAAFGIVSGIIRQATNHEIQSPGGMITKGVQRHVWDLQPSGVSTWVVCPMQVHDEIMAPVRPGYESQVKQAVDEKVNFYRQRIPLLGIDWKEGIPNWAGKK